jgi:signal transduction histidine kinase
MVRMRALLRSIWDEPRSPGAPARGLRDWALVALVIAATLVEGVVRPDLPARWLSVVLTILLVPTLLWRRSHPLWTVVVAFVGCNVTELAVGSAMDQYSLVFILVLPFALYRWGAGREAVLGSAVVVAKILLSWLTGYIAASEVLAGLVLLALVAALGTAVRFRAKARARELDQVKLLERERLARDLHDTVAHHVSAMAIRAQAGLATMDIRPGAAADALRVIEAEASRTLTEMRTIVRALRADPEADGDADRSPAPRIADLPGLAAAGDRTGPAIEVSVEGDLDHVPASVDAAVYRLAQESVTNARRHARHATRIQVRVAAADGTVRLVVTDDGAPHPSAAGAGYGLLGMSERAALLGGTCEAGPAPDRGWRVTAVLPLARA